MHEQRTGGVEPPAWLVDETLKADVSAISGAVERVLTALCNAHCALGTEDAVGLAIREALANAIVHGCADDPRAVVYLSVKCDDAGGVLIVVRDCGGGFDTSTVPSPLDRSGLQSPHGRGIFLIRQLMDEVEFRSGGTEIHMRKR